MSVWSEHALELAGTIQEAMDDWRRENDPADLNGLTMAESIALRLAQKGLVAR